MKRITTLALLLAAGALLACAQPALAYHHPTLGRFVQRDPAGYVDGMSLPEYCLGEPVARVDATGRASKKKCTTLSDAKKSLAYHQQQAQEFLEWASYSRSKGNTGDYRANMKKHEREKAAAAYWEKEIAAMCDVEDARAGWVKKVGATATNKVNPDKERGFHKTSLVLIGIFEVGSAALDPAALLSLGQPESGAGGVMHLRKMRMQDRRWLWGQIQCCVCACKDGRLKWTDDGHPEWRLIRLPSGLVAGSTEGMSVEEIDREFKEGLKVEMLKCRRK